MHSRAQAATATSAALSVPTGLRSGNYTGRMEEAERISHASKRSAEPLLLLARLLLASSGLTVLSSPRRSGSGAARHAWPRQRCPPTSAVRRSCFTAQVPVFRGCIALAAAGYAFSCRACHPRRCRHWCERTACRCSCHRRCWGPIHAKCSAAERSHQYLSRTRRTRHLHCCLVLLLSANVVQCCSAARLPPGRILQAVSRFPPHFLAGQLRRIIISALRSICCGLTRAAPCCMRSALLPRLSIGLFIALQTQQHVYQPFFCTAEVDTLCVDYWWYCLEWGATKAVGPLK